MKTYAWLAVLCCGTAAADPMVEDGVPQPPVQAPHGASLDIGAMLGRVEPFAGTVLTVETIHVAPRISIYKLFYVGADLDVGRLSGNGQSQQSVIGVVSGNPNPAMGDVPLDGTIAMVRGVIGARMFTGPFSGGAELAVGARDLDVKDVGATSGTSLFDAVYDVRARFDFWATPQISVGAIADLGLEDRNDISLALVAGFHMMPYDASR